ncbi:MAG TPA: hypothetical protein VFP90_02060, partial [Gemmatimonadaceae bacterium]|nr:hypothetical protein [Gemmatimonadaceae bacterium]
MALRDGKACRGLVVSVDARGAIRGQHRVAERFAVVTRGVIVTRDIRDRRRRSQLERTRDSTVEVRARTVRDRSPCRVGEHGMGKVVLAPVMSLGAYEHGRRHPFVDRPFDVGRLPGARGNEQVRVERAAEQSGMSHNGRSTRGQALDAATHDLCARWRQLKLVERPPFPARAGVPEATVVHQRAQHLRDEQRISLRIAMQERGKF